jgi:hypothetical protein
MVITLYSNENESCLEYAKIVCDICGEDSEACTTFTEKSKTVLNDPACEKGVELLPSTYEQASTEQKEVIKRAVCNNQAPAS